jgi:hypothetical protein
MVNNINEMTDVLCIPAPLGCDQNQEAHANEGNSHSHAEKYPYA